MSTDAVIRTLLLTDLVGSTALTTRLGDEQAARLFASADRIARELIAKHSGTEIDKSDGFLLLFDRPIDSVAFALEHHESLRALSLDTGNEILARTGIHLGEVILRENTPREISRGAKRIEVEGLSKQLAARTATLALGGQTLLTRAAFDLSRRASTGNTSITRPVQWLAHGPYQFKGADETIEIFEVGESQHAPLRPPPNSDKAYRAIRPGEEELLGWRPSPATEVKRRPGWILQRKLGEGGFGEVWLATNERTREPRVFKFCFVLERLRTLKRELTLFLLMREALGQRDDIQRLYDLNFDEPPYFLEMDYSDGGDLEDWTASLGGPSKVPLELRITLAAQAADAAAAAHSLGILHKDIKPRNILIDTRSGSPRARLTDFGIGQLADKTILDQVRIQATGFTEDTLRGTELSSRTGTRLYMAPELLAGKLPSIQSDVFALGVLLFQLIIGDFSQAVTVDWSTRIHDHILRQDLADCLAGDPAKRIASAAELATRLRELPARRKARRRRTLVKGALIAAVIVTIALIAALFLIQSERTRADREQSLRKAAELHLYNSLIRTAQAAIEASDLDQARKDLEATPTAYRQWEWNALLAAAHPEVCDLGKVGAPNALGATVAFDPSGRYIATGNADGRLTVRNLNDVSTAFTYEAGTHNDTGITGILFSSDGKRMLAALRDQELAIFDTNNWQTVWQGPGRTIDLNIPGTALQAGDVFPCIQNERTLVLRTMNDGTPLGPPLEHPYGIFRAAITADRRTVYTAGWAKTAFAWDVHTGKKIGELFIDVVGFRGLQIMPDGQSAALIPDWPDRKIRLWQPRANTLRTLECLGHHSMTFSPDGRYLVTNFENGGIQFYDLETDRNLGVLEGTVDSSYLAFSPDGTRLISQSLLGKLIVYDWATVIRLKTGRTKRFEEHHGILSETGIARGYAGGFALSADGNLGATAYIDGSVVLWDTSGLPPESEMYRLWAGVTHATTSDNGKVMAQGYTHSMIRVWNIETHRIRSHICSPWGNISRIDLSADGALLVASIRSGASANTPSLCVAITADTNTGRILHEFVAQNISSREWQEYSGAAITPDGKKVVLSIDEKTLGIYDTRTGSQLVDLGTRQGHIRGIAINPDATIIAASDSTGRITLWDMAGNILNHPIPDPAIETPVLTFLPDGSGLLAGDRSGGIRLFSTRDGRLLDAWRGASGKILDLAPHPREPRVLVTSTDKTKAIDSLESGHQRIATIRTRHDSNETWGSFQPDGNSLVISQGSGRNEVLATLPVERSSTPAETRTNVARRQKDRLRNWHNEITQRRKHVFASQLEARSNIPASQDALQSAFTLILEAREMRDIRQLDIQTSNTIAAIIDQLYANAAIGPPECSTQFNAYLLQFADGLGLRSPTLTLIALDTIQGWEQRHYKYTRDFAQDTSDHLRFLSRQTRALGQTTAADALLLRSAAAQLVTGDILNESIQQEIRAANLAPPPPPPPNALFEPEGAIASILQELAGPTAKIHELTAEQFLELRTRQHQSVQQYLDNVAPLPDIPALRQAITPLIPEPSNPPPTIADICKPILSINTPQKTSHTNTAPPTT